MTLLLKSSQACLHASQFKLGIQNYMLPWPDVGNNVKDDPSDHITYFSSSNVQVL
jgi:hypothetical protein